MRKVSVFVNGIEAGILVERSEQQFQFNYHADYQGAPVSLTMPIKKKTYDFKHFPPFFEGLLPEGIMLEALLRKYKLDKNDFLGQLIIVGKDMVGAVTVEEIL